MSEPFLGQIQPFGFNFAPRGWALCAGQLLSIQQNTALFALLGTTYGGDGRVTFALPDLRGRVPMHFGTAPDSSFFTLGEMAGEENVTLLLTHMPAHNHTFAGTTSFADSKRPVSGSAYASTGAVGSPGEDFYAPSTSPTALHPSSLGSYGGGQPHENRQPYLTINWCIALEGIFPSRP